MTDSVVCNSESISPTSSSLLECAKAYDQAAWHRLVRLYGPLVYHWIRRKGIQPADARDIGQQVFASVARKIVDFRRDRPDDTFRGWLNRITKHKIIDHQRRQAGQRWVDGPWGQHVFEKVHPCNGALADNRGCTDEQAWIYRRAAVLLHEEFEERTWQAFWQTAINERKAKDVAAEFGMTTNAVYLARRRVLGRLREEFEDLLDVSGAVKAPNTAPKGR
jgi:RNA polymerase sigma-70 factor, ECF subfamily